MNFTKLNKGALKHIFSASLFFILLFCIIPLCLAFVLPKKTTSDNTYLLWPSFSEKKDSPVFGKRIEYSRRLSFSETKKTGNEMKNDLGLVIYHQLLSQNAIIDFYEGITDNRDVTLAIFTYANKYDIPLTLAFSLAYNESRYLITAVNSNTNTSIDRGLFQLNSNSFPELTEKEFFDPYTSAEKGLSFLRYCLDIGGNEITALAMYNAGPNRVKNGGTPEITLDHISNIITYQDKLEKEFNKAVALANENAEYVAIANVE